VALFSFGVFPPLSDCYRDYGGQVWNSLTMKFIQHGYRLLNLLSLDVAAGAAIGAAFFAHVLAVELFPQAFIVLGLTVWVIYTSDHLLDAWFLDKPASTPRHLLHQRRFKLLAFMVVIALLVDLALVLLIRRQLMVPGVVMSLMCAAYLVLNRWLRYVKEVVATLLYSAGVLLPALALNQSLNADQKLLITQFVLIVFLNMLLFAKMSYDTDLSDRQNSLFTTIGPRASDMLIAGTFVALGIVMLWPSSTDIRIKAVMAVMAMTLLVIFLFPAFFRSEERYRLLGDSIFLLPGLVLIFR
jgi:hypothetical protein